MAKKRKGPKKPKGFTYSILGKNVTFSLPQTPESLREVEQDMREREWLPVMRSTSRGRKQKQGLSLAALRG